LLFFHVSADRHRQSRIRGGATRNEWPAHCQRPKHAFRIVTPKFTTRKGEGIEIAASAARKGAQLIIACGGDGTISEVANGILSAGGESVLGVLPSGTGGDFRRTLIFPLALLRLRKFSAKAKPA